MSDKTWTYEYPDGESVVVATLNLSAEYERHAAAEEAALGPMKSYGMGLFESQSAIFSFRSGINQMAGSLILVLGITEQAGDTAERLRNAVMLSYIISQAYAFAASLLRARQAEESVWATIETAAAALAQQWPSIALAAGAAALVVGSFEAGYQFGSGSWSFNIDTSTPQGRRMARDEFAALREPRGG